MSTPIVFLMGTMFLASIGFGVILPTLPFLARQLGATPFDTGLAISVFAIAQLMSSPLWGWLSDRVGRRPVLVIGVVGYGATSALLGIAPNVGLLLLLRFVAGALAAAVFPSAQALAADRTVPQDRARILGYMGSVNSIGFIIGPPVGSFLSVFGVNVPFIGVGLLAVVNGILGLWLLPRKSTAPEPGVSHVVQSEGVVDDPVDLVKSLAPWAIVPYLFGSLIGAIADSSIAATLAYFFTGYLHSTQTVTGWAFMVNGATAALVQVMALPIVYKRFGEASVIVVGFTLGTLGYFTLSMSGYVWNALLGIVVLSCCSGLVYPVISAAISIRTPRRSQGRSFGAQQAANSMGRTFGPMVAGWLFTVHAQDPFFLASGLMACMALFFIFRIFKLRSVDMLHCANQGERDISHWR